MYRKEFNSGQSRRKEPLEGRLPWLQKEHILAAVWLCKRAAESVCSFCSRASRVPPVGARRADEYSPPRWGRERWVCWLFWGPEALGPRIYFSLVLWEISTCLFWKQSAISVNSIKVHISVCELHRIAPSNLPPLPIRLCLLAGRGWLEAALRIVGTSSVSLLLWNWVVLSELQVWMWKKSDFLKNFIFFFSCYMIAVYLGQNWGFYENINAWFHAMADGKHVCYCRSEASGAICETTSFSSIINPFLWADISLDLSFPSWGGRVSKSVN